MEKQYLKTVGEFDCIVHKPHYGWLGKSKEKQTPYIQLELEVACESAEDGQIISWFGYLSDKAIGNTIDTLVAAFDFNGDITGLVAGTQTFDGLKCNITVEEEDYNGKTMFKVRWLNPIGYVHTPRGIDESEAKMLAAGLSKVAKAAAEEARANRGKESPQEAPRISAPTPKLTGTEDDVPF